MVVICGSASSWVLDKLVNNHGGLYNRVTCRIHLSPFTLKECEQYMNERRIDMSRHQLLTGYMVMGGIPYYWSQLHRGMSIDQNIDLLFFSEHGMLRHEFEELYASLFKHPDSYIQVISVLGSKRRGLTREELINTGHGISDNGKLSRILKDLEYSGFIRSYQAVGKKKRNALFQLTDNFTVFHFQFMKDGGTNDEHYWTHHIDTPTYNSWCGLAYERVCLAHIPQIKRALGIDGIASSVYSWQSPKGDDEKRGAQIDLLIDRADNTINICEIKFSTSEYRIDKAEAEKLRNRKHRFLEETGTRKALHLTMITTYGLEHNSYWGEVQQSITLDDLMQ